jgi:hypothetical protein
MVRGRQARIRNYFAENRLFAVRSLVAGVVAGVLLLAVASRLRARFSMPICSEMTRLRIRENP